jgi:RNA polymerase sigma factor (TIGR02999 family)
LRSAIGGFVVGVTTAQTTDLFLLPSSGACAHNLVHRRRVSRVDDFISESEERGRWLVELNAELRRMAERLMANQPRHHTLQATALVNEVWLKLMGHEALQGEDGKQALCLAAKAMRDVLVDHARRKNRLKHCPPGQVVPLDALQVAYEEHGGDLTALDSVLEKLAGLDEELGHLVDLHFWGGLTMEETAHALGVSKRKAERRWEFARAWLKAELEGGS